LLNAFVWGERGCCQIFPKKDKFGYKIPVFIGVISNPLIYGITNNTHREAYKMILRGALNLFYKQEAA
jgi:hypothetical protein